ncbi:MAG: GlsB/YeaQ/YmgE family stress response membrane protein [Chromatiales bacterium]|nr:GlsB/YeaQ/YmgE family stress response membrane protein [Chromatiales bacterium]
MPMMSVVLLLILGGLAGWLAATLVRGRGLGVWGNIGVGIVGAVLGATLLGQMGVRLMGPFGQLVTALIGAVVLLWLARLFGKR